MASGEEIRRSRGRDDIGWSIAGGFYPALARSIQTHYKFTTVPTSNPIKVDGFYPKGGEKLATQAITDGWASLRGGGRRTLAGGQEVGSTSLMQSIAGRTRAPTAAGWITDAMDPNFTPANNQALADFVSGRILNAAMKFTLRGNHAWYETGLSPENTEELAGEVAQYLSGGTAMQSAGNTVAERARAFVRLIASQYNEFEVTDAIPAIQRMMERLAGEVIDEDELRDVTDEVLRDPDSLSYRADAKEEEWRAFIPAAGHGEAQEVSYSKVSGYDLAREIDEGGQRIAELWDATEDMALAMTQGSHGVAVAGQVIDKAYGTGNQDLRLLSGVAAKTDFSWYQRPPVGGVTNVERMENHVRALMLRTIEDPFNKMIRKIKEGQEWQSIDADWERFGETLYGSQTVNAARTSTTAIQHTVTQGILGTARQQMLARVGSAKGQQTLSPTPSLITPAFIKAMEYEAPTWTALHRGKPPAVGKRKERAEAMMGFLLHSLFAGPIAVSRGATHQNVDETRYGISFRVSQQNELGESWYAGIRLGHFLDGPRVFEFDESITKARDGVFVIMGPNFSLALQVKDGIISEQAARHTKLHQGQIYAVNRGSSGSQLTSVNSATFSAVNSMGTKTSYPTRLVYNPNIGSTIFQDFLNNLAEQLSKDSPNLAAAHSTVTGAMATERHQFRIDTFDNFWALPYVTVEDSLERISHEAAGWFNKKGEGKLAAYPATAV